MKGILLKLVCSAFIAAFLSKGAFGAAHGPIPMMHVDGGIIALGTEETYVSPFSIAREAALKESLDDTDCVIPSVPEYLMAAKLPDFKVSQAFESLHSPPDDACTWNRDVLEAEGVDGNFYFGGIGSHVPAELEFISGGTDPRDSISRIHSNIFTFWDDEYKPSPRAARCVKRDAHSFLAAKIHKETVQVRTRRSEAATVKMTLNRGTQVTIIHTNDNWSFITAEGSHPCQTDPEWTKFEDTGWILTTDYK